MEHFDYLIFKVIFHMGNIIQIKKKKRRKEGTQGAAPNILHSTHCALPALCKVQSGYVLERNGNMTGIIITMVNGILLQFVKIYCMNKTINLYW